LAQDSPHGLPADRETFGVGQRPPQLRVVEPRVPALSQFQYAYTHSFGRSPRLGPAAVAVPHPVRLARTASLFETLDLSWTQEQEARRFAHSDSPGHRVFDYLHAAKLMRTEFGSVGYFR